MLELTARSQIFISEQQQEKKADANQKEEKTHSKHAKTEQ